MSSTTAGFISLPEPPSPRRTLPSAPSGARWHGSTHEISTPEAARGRCSPGLKASWSAEKSLVVENCQRAEAPSFSSKDRFGGCCKWAVARRRT